MNASSRSASVLLCCLLGLSPAILTAETPAEKIDRADELLRTPQYEKGEALLEEAMKELRAAAAKDPGNAETFYQLGRACFFANKDARAIKHFDKAIRLAPKQAKYRYMKGMLLRYGKRLDEAQKELAACLKIEPTNPDYHIELARILLTAKKTAEAVKVLDQGLKADPAHAGILFLKGVVLTETGRNEEAARLFQASIKADPDAPRAHHNLGQTYQTMGKHKLAMESFRKAVQLDPDNWQARAKIIQGCQALGDLKARDAEREKLFAQRTERKNPSLMRAAMYCREQFVAGGRNVMVFEHFELVGERALRYVFYILKPKVDEIDYKFSLGSYRMTNAIARESGSLKPGQRLFHLDRYTDRGHATFGMYYREPSYEETRTMIVKVLEAEAADKPIQPQSSLEYPARKTPKQSDRPGKKRGKE